MPTPPVRVLIIDDGPFAGLLMRCLNKLGLEVKTAANGQAGVHLLEDFLPDVIVLDMVLKEGWSCGQTLAALKQRGDITGVPIMIVSGIRCEPEDEAWAFAHGARLYASKDEFDGYAKSAGVRHILALAEERSQRSQPIVVGRVSLDPASGMIRVENDAIALSPREAQLMAVLMEAQGATIEARQIHWRLYKTWPAASSTIIKTHIAHIRRKLGRWASLIQSVTVCGYRFDSAALIAPSSINVN